MSTPSGAVYNRCRPVRPWNGLSSASRLRRVTTRCWKVYSALLLLAAPAALGAQNKQPVIPEHPEVVNLTLKGVKVVKPAELQQSIYTTASYCNSVLLKPFCWISKSKYFFTRKYLDHKELERDVLRIRIFYWKRGYRETEVKNTGGVGGGGESGVALRHTT